MTTSNRPTPEEASRLLQENENRRRDLAGAPLPGWMWLLQCAMLAVYGVTQDVWPGNGWGVFLLIAPLILSVFAQSPWFGARMGLRMAPNTWSDARPRWTPARLLGALFLVAVMVVALMAQTALHSAGVGADHTMAWTGAGVLLAASWPLVKRLFYSRVSRG
ncbi:hypothetical protein [Kineosporia succinea]|uniref:Uncharacterized protein n=1 Tax=Kineosporia succinea TaxID=84632 RepID=A0ABT9PCK5_9ACTN|nr:hypothetical protein [Kineosporia succinea]MDP9830443.1 hypothetical protein [Kineosporia succinea]